MTDLELLAQAEAQFERLRRVALTTGMVTRDGVRIPRAQAIADECEVMRDRIKLHQRKLSA
jgi:hypothetical protein